MSRGRSHSPPSQPEVLGRVSSRLAVLAGTRRAGNMRALDELHAGVIDVPPFEPRLLAPGHAVHFRCAAADDMRLDVMAVMRGVPDFETCWARRTIAPLGGVGYVDVLGLEDLVTAKKTRRDKNWPMVRRLAFWPLAGGHRLPMKVGVA